MSESLKGGRSGTEQSLFGSEISGDSQGKKAKKKKAPKDKRRPGDSRGEVTSELGEPLDSLAERQSSGKTFSAERRTSRKNPSVVKKTSHEKFPTAEGRAPPDRLRSGLSSDERTSAAARDLWTIALQEKEKKKDSEVTIGDFTEGSGEANVLFIGGKSSGKTTIIFGFLNRDEPPKPTTALDYTFGRKSRGANMTKDICHLWELGGGTSLSKMVQIPITLENMDCMSVMLVVDLSKPEELWVTLEVFLKEVRTHLRNLMSRLMSQKPDLANSLLKAAWANYGDDHPDKELLDPCPIPLTIIGTKYDVYQNFDPEKKKVISKTLRFLAHTNGASLQFFSMKIDSLMSKTKQLINHHAFKTQLSPTMSMDYTKPLLVPVGADALGQIGIPSLSSGELGTINARNPLELWKQAFCGFFPQVSVHSELGADPCKEVKYKETPVDAMRLQKDEELERYRRSCELKARDMASQEGHSIRA